MTESPDQLREAASTPSVLTFLIADVRGYTRFTLEEGDDAAARMADRFAEICEETLGKYQGRVIELRGDEALAVFASGSQAMHGAVALQQAFKQTLEADPSLPLKVGIGLEAGRAIPVRGGFRGGALNLAARLCSVAGAGEILATEALTRLAADAGGLAYVDRGPVSLKGLASPVRVFQVGAEGSLPDELPPLQPVVVNHPTNLPDDPTPFIGREQEIRDIAALLQQPKVRLVTLSGPGGTGKTRLSLEIGNTLLYSFPDGVFFCDLSPVAKPDLVPAVIAGVLEIEAKAGKMLVEALSDSLRDKSLLLILDNFEHLLEAAPAVARLLDECRELHILVTSRAPLHLSREHEHAVPPLAVPDTAEIADADTVSQYESVALFVERARAAKDSFALSPENLLAVAEICARLDGLPLAIELAAARVKLLPPLALLERLDRRLRLLTGGAADKPTRQQTLRAAIDWSYDALVPEEQLLTARLSVFAGGCSLEAAEAVCGSGDDFDLLEQLASLVDKNLVKQDGEDQPRFRMLETIREYALEKLSAAGEAEQLEQRHAEYFLLLAWKAEPELTGPDQGAWLARLDLELDNLRAAIRWFQRHSARGAEAEMALALWRFWYIRGYYEEALQMLDRAAETFAGRPDEVARAMTALGLLHNAYGTPTAGIERLEAFLSSADSMEAPSVGYVYAALATLYRQLSRYQDAKQAATRAVELARAGQDNDLLVQAERLRGTIFGDEGDFAAMARILEDVLPLAEEQGNASALADVLRFLASAYEDSGNVPLAHNYFERALELVRRVGARDRVAGTLIDLARIEYRVGAWDQSKVHIDEALGIHRRIGRSAGILGALYTAGALATLRGQWDRAATYMDEVIDIAGKAGNLALQRYANGFLAQGDILQRNPERALARLEPLLKESGEESDVTWLLPVVAWACNELGDRSRAEKVVGQALRRTGKGGYAIARVDALWVAGRIAAHDDRLHEAELFFKDGIALTKAVGFPFGELRTRFEYALMLLRANRHAKALPILKKARAEFERLGSAPYVELTDQVLNELKTLRGAARGKS
jgi:predicted ATPase/class 3 adenylate cyclase